MFLIVFFGSSSVTQRNNIQFPLQLMFTISSVLVALCMLVALAVLLKGQLQIAKKHHKLLTAQFLDPGLQRVGIQSVLVDGLLLLSISSSWWIKWKVVDQAWSSHIQPVQGPHPYHNLFLHFMFSSVTSFPPQSVYLNSVLLDFWLLGVCFVFVRK